MECIRVKVTHKRRATSGLIFRYTCFPFFLVADPSSTNTLLRTPFLLLNLFIYYYFFSLSDLKPIILDFYIFPTPSILCTIP